MLSAVFGRKGISLTACLFACSLTLNGEDELKDQQDRFIAKLFTKCSEPISQPDTYYFGPRKVLEAQCRFAEKPGRPFIDECAETIEYSGLTFPKVPLELPLLPLDVMNHVERKALIVIDYTSYRIRLRSDFRTATSTRSQRVWDPWSEPIANAATTLSKEVHDRISPTAKAIGLMIKKNGQWIFGFGPDFPMGTFLPPAILRAVPGAERLPGARDASRETVGPAAGVLISGTDFIEEMARQKPKSCDDPIPRPPLPPSAPGHSLGDTYARTMELEKENARKGIRDDVRDFVGLPVCFAIDRTGRCDKAPESVYVPGDLAKPLDWDALGPGICRRQPGLVLEVELKAAPHEKRFLNCITAGSLAAARKRMIDLGVKPEVPPAPEAAGLGNVSSSPPIHSLGDTAESTLEIIDENARHNVPDRLRAGDLPFAYVCSAIVGTGQCQRTGEVVKVPGDLAVPLDWDLISQPGYCANRLKIGEEIVLKKPLRNDGKTRFMRCTDAMRLAKFYLYLVQLGVKQ
jgi:hypothetical protein